MKIKKISFLILTLGLTSNIFANEIESFKKGFIIGLEAVDYQLKHEGYEPKTIQLESPFIVIMDIKNISTNEILYFQHLLAKENIDSLITKDFLLIKSFDRKPDAQSMKKILETKYNTINLEIRELTDGTIETYPILFTRTFDKVINNITKNNDIAYVKKYETPLQIRLEKEKNKAKAYKYFKLKNSAMSYKYKYDKDSNIKCGDTRSKCFESKLFYENRIFKIGTKFKKGGVYQTSDGEFFQKVYNTNLFIDINDVAK